MLDKILELNKKLGLASHWKVFVFNFLAIFVLVGLQQLHLKPPPIFKHFSQVISPVPPKVDVFDLIKVKLMQKENHFQIKEPASFAPAAWAAASYDDASAYAAVDLDSGEVLAKKDIKKQLPIASLTKIMTAVVALDLASKDDQFIVPAKAEELEPTTIGVVTNQKMTLEELLNAALMTSANDAVEVIREGIDQKYIHDYSVASLDEQPSLFVKAMNAKAQILGLKDTHFENPQGFDGPNQYSSIADLIVLSQYALENYPLIREVVQKDYQFIPATADHKKFDLYNWNGLLGVYPGVYGVKIGNTDQAGKTMVVSSKREGKRIMAAVLGAPTIVSRDLWTADLLDLGFSKAVNLPPIAVTEDQLKARYKRWKYWL